MNSEQLHIRRVQESDLPHILHWENNIEGWNLHDKENPYSPVDILVFIGEQSNVYEAGQVRWIVCLESIPIGAADLTDIDFEQGIASVGILIAEQEHRRKGFAKRALFLLEEQAAGLGINRLISSIHPTNEISINLFKKLGYIESGKGEDSFILNGIDLPPIEFEKWLKK